MILITGGAGYIGGHCALSLLDHGYKITILDNYVTGHHEIANLLKKYAPDESCLNIIYGDLTDYNTIKDIFNNSCDIDSVIHLASYSSVEESRLCSDNYIYNNVEGTRNLLKAMDEYDVNKLVFSSTAAVYGNPKYLPIDEDHPLNPINPYGTSKVMAEKIIQGYGKKINYVILRYFNVVGADQYGRIGEWHEPETHLIPNLLKSAINHTFFELNGNDYPTDDGTCIRDYVNIEDIVDAHLLALDYLGKNDVADCFNLGTSKGYTIKEIILECEKVTGHDIPVIVKPRRVGDPSVLVADNRKIKKTLGWEPKHSLSHSVETAYEWEKRNI